MGRGRRPPGNVRPTLAAVGAPAPVRCAVERPRRAAPGQTHHGHAPAAVLAAAGRWPRPSSSGRARGAGHPAAPRCCAVVGARAWPSTPPSWRIRPTRRATARRPSISERSRRWPPTSSIRGRVLPTLDRRPDGAVARWRPVVQGLDAVAFDALVGALPPVGRAEATAPVRATPAGADPHALLTDALAVLTDLGVRDRLARSPCPIAIVPPRRGRAVGPPPAAEAWLAALLTPDARIGGAQGVAGRELDTLAAAVEAWDEVGAGVTGAGRACFRLNEVSTLHDPSDPGPDPHDQTGDGTRWVLEFLLQSTADPSLLVPAEQVWRGEAARLIAEPQELLLAELGRAALVLPELAVALRLARPSGARPRSRRCAPVPHRGRGATRRGGVRRSTAVRMGRRAPGGSRAERPQHPDRPGGHPQAGWAASSWPTSAGRSRSVTTSCRPRRSAELVAAKAPLVRLRGRWVTVDAERLRAGLEFLRGRHPPRQPVGRTHRRRGARAGAPPPRRLRRARRRPAAGHGGPRRRLARRPPVR